MIFYPLDEKTITESVLKAFNNNDVAAFKKVYDHLFMHIYLFAKKITGKEHAEDITADVFCKLWSIEKKFNSLKSLRSFLLVMTRNRCIDLIRRNKLSIAMQKELAHTEKSNLLYEHTIIEAELIKIVYKEIEMLPPVCKTVFKMAYINGTRTKEISAKLGISENTVHNHITKAFQKLRQAIGPKKGSTA